MITQAIGVLFAVVLPALSEMTLEEKTGQLLLAGFRGEEVNEEARILTDEVGVGGVLYYSWANGLMDPVQVQQLSRELQEASALPLLIAIDQEGGVVTRLGGAFTHFYGNRALGIAGDPVLAEQAGFAMGEEMRAVGINLNFAPVVDVHNSSRGEGVSWRRTFGDTPELVAEIGAYFVAGLKRASILATLKHFPGHGDADGDSHEGLPWVRESVEELEARALLPFGGLLPHVDLVMTGHLFVPALDPAYPATFSRAILQGLLREQMGYQGVVVSDSLLMMGALEGVSSVEEAAIAAFNAGCDLLVLGGKRLNEGGVEREMRAEDVARVHRALTAAVRSGRIAEERVDAAVGRIFQLKRRMVVECPDAAAIARSVGTEEHQELARRIFDLSLRCAKPVQPVE